MNTLSTVLMALMNSLWQSALLAALVWLALRFARRVSAATRFAIWWAALGVVAILPAAPRMIATAREWSEPATLRSTRPISLSRPQVRIMDAAPLITVEPRRMVTWPWWIATAWALAFLYRLAQVLRSP
jgi:hypothetical protein